VSVNYNISDWSRWSTSTVPSTPQWNDGNSFVAERITNFSIPKLSLEKMARNISDEIDTEVMNNFLRQSNHKNIVPFEAAKFDPENLWSEPNV
jgi:hypothetical protein